MSKKNVNPNTLYRKNGRKYEPAGLQFNGFPADGIWLVQDGKASMTCLIGAKERVPIFALNYRLHIYDLCKIVQEKAKELGWSSIMEECRWACDYFAELAERQGK